MWNLTVSTLSSSFTWDDYKYCIVFVIDLYEVNSVVMDPESDLWTNLPLNWTIA